MQEFENVWKLKKFDRQISAQLGEELSIATPIANILAGRGLKDVKEVEKFCRTDINALRNPFLLPDIRPVLARLNKALDNNEKIFVWGDYDEGRVYVNYFRRQLNGSHTHLTVL